MVLWLHCGLYFTPTQVQDANKHAKREPFQAAWNVLRQPPVPELIPSTLWNGLRYRFDHDETAGRKAIDNLLHDPLSMLDHSAPYLDQVMTLLAWAQCFELVRDHAACNVQTQQGWLEAFTGQITPLIQYPSDQLSQVERIWQALLNVAAGVMLEDDTLLQQGAAYYRTVIDHDVHPEGYLPSVVEQSAGDTSSAILRLLVSVKGLVLMAAAAETAGLDLWHYHNRGVSIVTAGLYPLYYYFYPEKWRWDQGLDQPEVERLFRLHGSWLEPLNYHIRQPTRAIDLILKDLRPVVDIWGGGLLTLSHGIPIRRGFFG